MTELAVTMHLGRLMTALSGYRVTWTHEKALQAGVQQILEREGFAFSREHTLSPMVLDRGTQLPRIQPGSIVDFFVLMPYAARQRIPEGIALEVKIRCPRSAMLRQLHRYAAYEEVMAVLLLTPSLRFDVPPTLCGKPAKVIRVPRL